MLKLKKDISVDKTEYIRRGIRRVAVSSHPNNSDYNSNYNNNNNEHPPGANFNDRFIWRLFQKSYTVSKIKMLYLALVKCLWSVRFKTLLLLQKGQNGADLHPDLCDLKSVVMEKCKSVEFGKCISCIVEACHEKASANVTTCQEIINCIQAVNPNCN